MQLQNNKKEILRRYIHNIAPVFMINKQKAIQMVDEDLEVLFKDEKVTADLFKYFADRKSQIKQIISTKNDSQ